jgi:hypothetical protein
MGDLSDSKIFLIAQDRFSFFSSAGALPIRLRLKKIHRSGNNRIIGSPSQTTGRLNFFDIVKPFQNYSFGRATPWRILIRGIYLRLRLQSFAFVSLLVWRTAWRCFLYRFVINSMGLITDAASLPGR